LSPMEIRTNHNALKTRYQVEWNKYYKWQMY
jgi:hypothetical protein